MFKIIKCNRDNCQDTTNDDEYLFHIKPLPMLWCFCFGFSMGLVFSIFLKLFTDCLI